MNRTGTSWWNSPWTTNLALGSITGAGLGWLYDYLYGKKKKPGSGALLGTLLGAAAGGLYSWNSPSSVLLNQNSENSKTNLPPPSSSSNSPSLSSKPPTLSSSSPPPDSASTPVDPLQQSFDNLPSEFQQTVKSFIKKNPNVKFEDLKKMVSSATQDYEKFVGERSRELMQARQDFDLNKFWLERVGDSDQPLSTLWRLIGYRPSWTNFPPRGDLDSAERAYQALFDPSLSYHATAALVRTPLAAMSAHVDPKAFSSDGIFHDATSTSIARARAVRATGLSHFLDTPVYSAGSKVPKMISGTQLRANVTTPWMFHPVLIHGLTELVAGRRVYELEKAKKLLNSPVFEAVSKAESDLAKLKEWNDKLQEAKKLPKSLGEVK